MNNWKPASKIVMFKEYHSTAMKVIPILLAIPGAEYPLIGWYFSGNLNVWKLNNSPSDQHPTHFIPLPKLPLTLPHD